MKEADYKKMLSRIIGSDVFNAMVAARISLPALTRIAAEKLFLEGTYPEGSPHKEIQKQIRYLERGSFYFGDK